MVPCRMGISTAAHWMVVLSLLGCPRPSSAATWSTISLPVESGDLLASVTADAAGDLFVLGSFIDADGSYSQLQIRKRDAQGNWSVLTDVGGASVPRALATDAAGNLYVALYFEDVLGDILGSRVQKWNPQGDWVTVATQGSDLGQVFAPDGLAVDTAGALYVADRSNGGRIQKRDARGNWSLIATSGPDLGQVDVPRVLAVDEAADLYVAQAGYGTQRVQQRDARGNWSILATEGHALGRIDGPVGLAVDVLGNLYVAESYGDPTSLAHPEGARIQKRDVHGNWSVIATQGTDLGQVRYPGALAVDGAGNLYVADTGNNRVLKYSPEP